MDDVIDLAHKRRVKESEEKEDCTLITPEDSLKMALEDIRTGKIKPYKMVICIKEESDNYSHYTSNCKLIESLGLMDVIKDIMLKNSGN